MSPRRKKMRKVLSPPPIKGFKPYGGDASEKGNSLVFMHYEEYEAIRLCDYDGYNHHQASVLMDVSRPTFTRIYAAARQKIASAMVEGRQISIEGGKVYFDSDWYHCANCECYFNNPERENLIKTCPLCYSEEIESYELDTGDEASDSGRGNRQDKCYCPSCGMEKEHVAGKPCSRELCPACSAPMKRKGTSFSGNRKRGKR